MAGTRSTWPALSTTTAAATTGASSFSTAASRPVPRGGSTGSANASTTTPTLGYGDRMEHSRSPVMGTSMGNPCLRTTLSVRRGIAIRPIRHMPDRSPYGAQPSFFYFYQGKSYQADNELDVRSDIYEDRNTRC